jgi:GGDEF domain-containing protein
MKNLNARKTVKAKVAISIGHAVFDPGKPATLDELLSRADQQMYKMKKIKYRLA